MNIERILGNYKSVKHNLIPILHEIQDSNPMNFISEDDILAVANYLNLSYAEVFGVVGYYSMFSFHPRGNNIIRICKSPVCNMLGSENIMQIISDITRAKPGETSDDKLFTLEFAECLGYCDRAPAMMINREVYGDLTKEKIEKILEKYR